MSSSAKWLIASLLLPVILSPRGHAQRPQFHSGIDLVTLDVTAIGPDGWPVRDLRLDEVTVTVNGRVRPLKSFEFVEVAPRADLSAPDRPAPASAFASNRSARTGRSVFVVVFHEHIRTGNERIAMNGVAAMIDRLSPQDRVAVITMPFGRVEVDLTSDHGAVKRRLSQIVGRSSEFVPTGQHTTAEKPELLAFLEEIAKLEGAKTVVLISEGFSGDNTPQPAVDSSRLEGPRPADTGTATLLDVVSRASGGDLETAAAAARAQFYIVQPLNLEALASSAERWPGSENIRSRNADLSADRPESEMESRLATRAGQTQALRALAARTGGRLFELSGDATPVFERIVRESSGYYAIAFESDPDDLKERTREVTVRTARRDVTLSARRTYPAAALPSAVSARTMLSDARAYTDVPMQAAAYSVRAADGNVRVIVLADAPGRELKDVGMALVDAHHTVTAAWPGEPSASDPIVSSRIVAPGYYRLRVAGVDADGRGGAVDVEFTAGVIQFGAWSAGSLMLGRTVAGRLKPQLAFMRDTDLTPYFEWYGDAKDLEVTFAVSGSAGETLLETAADVNPTSDADRWIVSGQLPLISLTPANYAVRAVVRVAGEEIGTLTARMRIE